MPGPQLCGRHTVQGQPRKAAGRNIKKRMPHASLREASAQTKNYFLFLSVTTAPTMLTAAAASAG